MHFSSALVVSAVLSAVVAHPGGHDVSPKEMVRRSGLSKRCESAAGAMNQKRWAAHQEKRSLASRDVTPAPIHNEPFYKVIQNDTCILEPEVTAGPYFWPQSQTMRQDMAEDQPGVPLYLDIGVLDTNNCKPLADVLVDLWHCNATGSYSSFEAHSPDTPFLELLAQLNQTFDPMTRLDLHTGNTTWLRGMWPTNKEGMMEMKTVFPGFYIERTIHIHAQVHTKWAIGANGTIASGNTVSTGQIYFDEDVSKQIMALEPYTQHDTINRTTNVIDPYFGVNFESGFNPVMSVVPLDGKDITKGMVAYITLGVNATDSEVDGLGKY
ncbi:hypothetical protein HYFRA_00010663 [Hymenoscyphus fraxineus]|uniref:Intradiol ring-cleavage dioxygenases domain-containing protein n=1 Tax=Hymenoscyphus fraxineus TaxID=746836 RepID=A0A9N9PMY8_9HELO|nr:hypothetical protein HYFRA_00010663 [Hymenoscyphus fraxineus]